MDPRLIGIAMVGLGLGGYGSKPIGDDIMDDWPPTSPVQRVIFKEPNLATFTSEKPLTKRQKRRLRGKTPKDQTNEG